MKFTLPKLFARKSPVAATPARRSLENPANPLTAESLEGLYGIESEAGVNVTGEAALRLSTVYTCVKIVSQTMATVNRGVFDVDAAGVANPVIGGRLNRLLTVEPCEYMSAYDFILMMQAHFELWGNAYAAIERDGAGRVRNLLPLISRNVEPVRQNGKLYYYVSFIEGGGEAIPASEVIHLRNISLNGLAGLAPVALGKNAIGLTQAAENYGSRFFKNDARPGVVLKHEKNLSEGAARRLKENWLSRYGGTNRGMPAVLEEGLDFSEVGIAPEAAQFLETRKFQRQEIAAMFGVPLTMLADPDARAYASGEHDDLRYTKHTVLPRSKMWEAELNRKLFRETDSRVVKHDLRELERGAFKDQMEAITKGVQNAVLTPNEGRARLGLPPKDGGDVLFLQQNMAGANAIASGTAGNGATNAVSGKTGEDPAKTENEDSDDEKQT